MSGGHWQHKQGWLDWQFAEEIEHIVNNKSKINIRGEYTNYSDEVIEKFKEAAKSARKLAEMIHCIDYLLSEDYGQETFLDAWKIRVNALDDKKSL